VGWARWARRGPHCFSPAATLGAGAGRFLGSRRYAAGRELLPVYVGKRLVGRFLLLLRVCLSTRSCCLVGAPFTEDVSGRTTRHATVPTVDGARSREVQRPGHLSPALGPAALSSGPPGRPVWPLSPTALPSHRARALRPPCVLRCRHLHHVATAMHLSRQRAGGWHCWSPGPVRCILPPPRPAPASPALALCCRGGA